MSLGPRLLVYFGLLTIGACLGILSVAVQIALSGWLARMGWIPNPCGHGCPEGWAVSFTGPFLIAALSIVGLFARPQPRYLLCTAVALVVYALALRWSFYGVQYAALVVIFGLIAHAAGRRAAGLIAGT